MSKRIFIASVLIVPLVFVGGITFAAINTDNSSSSIDFHSNTDNFTYSNSSGTKTNQISAGQTNSSISVTNNAGTVTFHNNSNNPSAKTGTTTTKTANGATVSVTNEPGTQQIQVVSGDGKDKTSVTTNTTANKTNLSGPKPPIPPTASKLFATYFDGDKILLASAVSNGEVNGPAPTGSSLTSFIGLYLEVAVPLVLILAGVYLVLFRRKQHQLFGNALKINHRT